MADFMDRSFQRIIQWRIRGTVRNGSRDGRKIPLADNFVNRVFDKGLDQIRSFIMDNRRQRDFLEGLKGAMNFWSGTHPDPVKRAFYVTDSDFLFRSILWTFYETG